MPTGPKTSLILERYTSIADGMGGYSHTWESKRQIAGVFSVISDRERMMYGKKAEGANYKFAIEYQIGLTLTAKDRLVSATGGRKFDIISREDPLEQHRMMLLFLSENVDG